jgi:hypothetical protein
MEINILGYSTRVEFILLSMILGAIIGIKIFCSCVSVPKMIESFVSCADIKYTMGQDVDNSLKKSVNQPVSSNVICERTRKMYHNKSNPNSITNTPSITQDFNNALM